MPNPESALRCKELVKRYGDTVAVAGLDLDVWRGECFGMLGPNGAGKTTTVEIFEGLRVPDSGLVEVLGESLARRRVGLARAPGHSAPGDEILRQAAGQRGRDSLPQLLPARPGRRGRARAGRARGKGRRVRANAVGRTEAAALPRRARWSAIRKCSSWTSRRPASIRKSRHQTWEIVEGLKARGRTVLLTTHYMEEAARLCDRVAVVDYGKVIALGTPRELIASLGAEHVIEFAVGEQPDAAGLDEPPPRAAQRGGPGA